MPISVTILTKNSEKYLAKVLDSLKSFDEVIVYDTGSKDSTLSIKDQYPNVRLIEAPFVGFGPTHNLASNQAKNDWVLSIDSDEIVTDELVSEIHELTLDPSCVYSIIRHNYFNGKWIKGCGWYPDRQRKLYNKKSTRFTDDEVHESIILGELKEVKLKYPLLHYSYGNTSDFLSKMQSYSTLFAKQNKGKKQSSTTKAIFHALFTFFKSYFLKKGFLDGKEGFQISVYNANTAFYKYIKLDELNRQI